MNGKTAEYRYSVSTPFEMSVKRSDGDYGSDGRTQSAFITVRFDDPAELSKLLSAELIDGLEKLRKFTRQVVIEAAKADEGFQLMTGQESLEDSVNRQLAEQEPKPEPKNDSYNGTEPEYTKICEECGSEFKSPYKPVDKAFRKKPYLCDDCYKKQVR